MGSFNTNDGMSFLTFQSFGVGYGCSLTMMLKKIECYYCRLVQAESNQISYATVRVTLKHTKRL